jgi:uracil-DNA glycosylase family 4
MLNDTYIGGMGNGSAKIAFVGEAPGVDDITTKKPFSGPVGAFFKSMLKDLKISEAACWFTNVSKYYVQPNPKYGKKLKFRQRCEESGVNLDQQVEELRLELQQINPNVVVALGGTALWALTGKSPIQDYRGSILYSAGHKVVGSYNPGHIVRQEGEVKGYWTKIILYFDLKRAISQSHFKEVILPQRHLRICESSLELHQFLDRYKSAKHPAVDIEADSCIPICMGLSFEPSVGLTVPLWNHLIDPTTHRPFLNHIPNDDLANMWILLAQFLAKSDIVGANFGYDRDKIKRLGFVIRSLHSDVMYKAFCTNPELPKNLAFLTSICTEEPFYKNEGMYEGSYEDLFIGCARDACVTKEVDIKLDPDIDELGVRDYMNNFLLPLHEFYLEIENQGFKVDFEKREAILRKYIEWSERNDFELFNLAEANINVNSPKQVASLLYGTWGIPTRKGTSEEVLTALLNNTVKDPKYRRGIELILENRRVKKSINDSILAAEDFDGRMRTSYFICLDTGRSATSQQAPPIRPNIEFKYTNDKGKKVKKKQALGKAFQTMTKHGDIGPEVRQQYIADDGYIFIQADSSQAEARVVFLLADDEQALEDIDKRDYHALTASWFVGGTEDDWSKRKLGYEHPNRFLGKTLRHAGHLGAGKSRASIEVNTQARKYGIKISIDEKLAGRALEIFHAKQPSIKQVFHAEVIKCLQRNRRLAAPVPYGIEAKVGGIRTFYERWGEELNRMAFSYIPQRTISENTKGAGFRIKKRLPDIKVVLESHDAFLFMVPLALVDEAAPIIKEEFERPIDFSTCSIPRRSLIIPCELEIGHNYGELSKFKWMAKEVA